MARMIDQLLDFSRIRLGLLNIVPHAGNLQGVCEAAIAEVRQAMPDADIRLQGHGDLAATFDPDRMTQVLINLVVNAVQHGSPGLPVEVRIDGRAADRLCLQVRNDGTLPDDVKDHLFTPFRESRAKDSPGLGLGLYIVDQFVRAHGGVVEVRSSAAEGTLFELHLPRRAGR